MTVRYRMSALQALNYKHESVGHEEHVLRHDVNDMLQVAWKSCTASFHLKLMLAVGNKI